MSFFILVRGEKRCDINRWFYVFGLFREVW